jgi:hypothetical protein
MQSRGARVERQSVARAGISLEFFLELDRARTGRKPPRTQRGNNLLYFVLSYRWDVERDEGKMTHKNSG